MSSSNFNSRNFAITSRLAFLKETLEYLGFVERSVIIYMSLPLLYNFMDSQRDLDFLNHKVKNLDEIRNSKYLTCMLPLTIPTSVADITNQWWCSFLMSLRLFLHTALWTVAATELERTQKMKTVFKCCINLFWGSSSPKRLWFWNQQQQHGNNSIARPHGWDQKNWF